MLVRNTEYSVLEETLARRTFDESGDYTIGLVRAETREHLLSTLTEVFLHLIVVVLHQNLF